MSHTNLARIIEQLTLLEAHHPNLCTMWKYYLIEKHKSYLHSLEQCAQVISTLQNNNIQDNMDQTIPFLCLLLHNNLLT